MDEWPAVQHWVLCRKVRAIPPVGPHNRYVLDGVGYRYEVPSSVGMSVHDPKAVKVLRLFARFFGGSGSADFEIQQWWVDDPASGERGTLIEVFGPHTVYFRPNEPVRDFVFALRRVPLVGSGRYQFRLIPLSSEPGDEPLAVEHLEVVQQ